MSRITSRRDLPVDRIGHAMLAAAGLMMTVGANLLRQRNEAMARELADHHAAAEDGQDQAPADSGAGEST